MVWRPQDLTDNTTGLEGPSLLVSQCSKVSPIRKSAVHEDHLDFQVCLERSGENCNDIVEARDHRLPAEIRLQRRDVTDTSKGLDEAAQAILGNPTSSIKPFEVPIREIEKNTTWASQH